MNEVAKRIIHDLPRGLLCWYNFATNAKVLYITVGGNVDLSLIDYLKELDIELEVTDYKVMLTHGFRNSEMFNYAIISDAVAACKSEDVLTKCFAEIGKYLSSKATLIVCTDNKLALRYFCGDRDPFSNRNYDSIESYQRISDIDKSKIQGMLFSKAELKNALVNGGFVSNKFYSVFPKIDAPQCIYAEDYMPTEDLSVRILLEYNSPDTVILEEDRIYQTLIKNGIFHDLANGFIIECCINREPTDVKQVTTSFERGEQNAVATIIREGCVEKRPCYKDNIDKVKQISESVEYLQQHGVDMIEGYDNDGVYVMPFVKGQSLNVYLKDKVVESIDAFYKAFDKLWSIIQKSSEHIDHKTIEWEKIDPWWSKIDKPEELVRLDRYKWKRIYDECDDAEEVLGPVLERGYIDLVTHNGFIVEDSMVFYDQEFYIENLPAKTILLRSVYMLYHSFPDMKSYITEDELKKRYKLDIFENLYRAQMGFFIDNLRNDNILNDYQISHRRSMGVVNTNRQRANYSTEEYLRIFVNVFSGLENRRLFLFGSGNFTKKFLAFYKLDYNIEGIIDNDASRVGAELEGIKIFSPEILNEYDPSTYKVIICIKNYTGVLTQLKELGVTNIGIYDPNMEYARKTINRRNSDMEEVDNSRKKYHVGYIAGVFDMFHVGHLNLLRRAKEQCEYLIVGVVSDEGVVKQKNRQPMIPLIDRIEIVRACKYVDEVVEIPLAFCDTQDAYRKFHFDVQFSGSDYEDNEQWLKKQEWLRNRGADLVFFTYTEKVSSTKLKAAIDEKKK